MCNDQRSCWYGALLSSRVQRVVPGSVVLRSRIAGSSSGRGHVQTPDFWMLKEACASLFHPRLPPFFDGVEPQKTFFLIAFVHEQQSQSGIVNKFSNKDFDSCNFFLSHKSLYSQNRGKFQQMPGFTVKRWLSPVLHSLCSGRYILWEVKSKVLTGSYTVWQKFRRI